MSRPLIGGSAAAAVLLSCSLLFLAQTSVAEPLGQSPERVRQDGAAAQTQTAGAETTTKAEAATEAAGVAEANKAGAAAPEAPKAAVDKSEPEAEAEASTPAVTFTATAYSLRGRTASGAGVRRGIIAADRRVLPIGTRVRLEAGPYSGEYLVADTGGAIRGRRIDIWMPHTGEAMRFGRRPVKLTVLTRTRPRTARL
ncbi:MAG: 3D domain-containing protein [Acidobacteria bacterium]|nr:3D domain-containing protein [Acidobacteriota bacterium]MCA1620728.1 3D domain-containing protein [Acidobacteriota bacterium]